LRLASIIVVSKITQIEAQLARAEGELNSLRSRSLEILHLISELAEAGHLEGILARRMQELLDWQAKCEEEVSELKRQIAIQRVLKK
jgi:hypothetical protein